MPVLTYKEQVLADSPLLYYRIDDAGSEIGGEAKDLGSLKLNGTYNGTVPLAEGALTVSGDTDKAGSWTKAAANFISVPENAGLSLLTTKFSIEAWLFPLVVLQQTGIVHLGQNNVGTEMFQDANAGGGFNFSVGTGGVQKNTIVTGQFTANKWTHMVGTYDNVTIRLYKDGAQVGTKALAGPVNEPLVENGIGLRGGAIYPANGRIDEVAIYGTTLSPARIQRHYTAGAQAPEPVVAAAGAMPRAGHKHPAVRIGALA